MYVACPPRRSPPPPAATRAGWGARQLTTYRPNGFARPRFALITSRDRLEAAQRLCSRTRLLLAHRHRSGYARRQEGGHPDPERPGAGRSARRRATLAAGLRRAAPTRCPATGPRTTRADASGDRAGPRGVPAAGRCREGPALEQPAA